MGLATQRANVEDLIRLEFPIVEPDVPYSFENIGAKDSPDSLFAAFGMTWGFTDKKAIGCDFFRYTGTVYASIYAPLNTGVANIDRVGDSYMKLIKDAAIDGMIFSEYTIASLRRLDTRYLLVVGAVFQIDELI